VLFKQDSGSPLNKNSQSNFNSNQHQQNPGSGSDSVSDLKSPDSLTKFTNFLLKVVELDSQTESLRKNLFESADKN